MFTGFCFTSVESRIPSACSSSSSSSVMKAGRWWDDEVTAASPVPLVRALTSRAGWHGGTFLQLCSTNDRVDGDSNQMLSFTGSHFTVNRSDGRDKDHLKKKKKLEKVFGRHGPTVSNNSLWCWKGSVPFTSRPTTITRTQVLFAETTDLFY